MEASGMVIVCVLLQLLDLPVKVKSYVVIPATPHA
jgi:hypothetical protein